ncbi:aldehyde dehydrogenase (NADP(+)) [Lignipirellula cremea]|uniref:NADP-dependent fatty aldehyde dehydrogenase n=1 Tax=Lignipirellula cremea TaxID=2528010 RepID=A0A518E2D7_9BACT|nr:aldehyde dehydrogenase (NADP(+)) [Lignipirellula cremea]QDU98251.1 NADP-dependent fatty aldehyde dehydrogenase [Lignipirellula cremea]
MSQPVLIDGAWRPADAVSTFQATNPRTKETLPDEYPISSWKDCETALAAAERAAAVMRTVEPEAIALFLETYADLIEENKDALVQMAHAETGLPVSPRLADGELPRTTGQLRQAAAAAREGSWRQTTIDSKANIRSYLDGIGPVCVFGPNNFPFAFGSISGGDFAAAIAAGNPVIAKANSSHPGVTRLFAEIAQTAAEKTGMPAGIVQLLYRLGHADGERLVADPRVGATGYTGSRSAGLALKAAADKAGKPIYLELSSVNPVVILPGALAERGAAIADEFTGSCLMGAGQFCTNPGMVVLIEGVGSEQLVTALTEKFDAAPAGTLLSAAVERSLGDSLGKLLKAGATSLTSLATGAGQGFSHTNALLQITGEQFLADPETMQTEAFGNASLLVMASSVEQAAAILGHLEGNLTGCIYSATTGEDDNAYALLEPPLRQRVGRLLNDKMPTGVAVSDAMNHGGPYPATGHPGYTAVGLPAAMVRFGMLQCYDNVRPARLPRWLRDKNPTGSAWRRIDGTWSQGDVS